MTINQLHKLTAKLIAQGAGRRAVCIDKATFRHPLESDGVSILDVASADLKVFEMSDDDGGAKILSDGRVATKSALVLGGFA